MIQPGRPAAFLSIIYLTINIHSYIVIKVANYATRVSLQIPS